GDDHVDVAPGDRRERLGAGAERHDGKAALLEPERDQIHHLALVVDHEHRRHAEPPGRYTVNVEPAPDADAMSIQPPCSRTMPQLTDSPRPVPSPTSLVV